jgi:hypothetical protein
MRAFHLQLFGDLLRDASVEERTDNILFHGHSPITTTRNARQSVNGGMMDFFNEVSLGSCVPLFWLQTVIPLQESLKQAHHSEIQNMNYGQKYLK